MERRELLKGLGGLLLGSLMTRVTTSQGKQTPERIEPGQVWRWKRERAGRDPEYEFFVVLHTTPSRGGFCQCAGLNDGDSIDDNLLDDRTWLCQVVSVRPDRKPPHYSREAACLFFKGLEYMGMWRMEEEFPLDEPYCYYM